MNAALGLFDRAFLSKFGNALSVNLTAHIGKSNEVTQGNCCPYSSCGSIGARGAPYSLWIERHIANEAPAERQREQREQSKSDRKEIKQLKKDLQRKEKAIAEAAALIILRKKAQAIWGDPEED